MNQDLLSVGDWIKYSTSTHPNRDGIILTMGKNSCTVQCIDLNVTHTTSDVVKYECIENISLFSNHNYFMDGCVKALCGI